MKVVSIGLYNPIPVNTGGDSYIYYLLNSIGKNNEVLHYYCSNLKSKQGLFPAKTNFQTKYLKSNLYQKFSRGKPPKIVQLGRPDLLLDRSFISKIKADVVICDTITYHIGKYISRKSNSPLILIKHDIVWKKLKSDGSKFYIPMMIYEKSIFKKVDAVTTISMKDYQYAVQYVDKNIVHYVPPGLDLDVFKPEGPSYAFGGDRFNLLFYGSLDRAMNIEALEFIKHRLIPLLQKERLLDKIRINIFGSGTPPKYLHLEQDKNINYLGVVTDPGEYIRGADLVIVPVRNLGGTKIRVLEVLFCGKSIIVTPETAYGLPDELKKFVYIEKDGNGFLGVIKQFLENHKVDKTNVRTIKDYLGDGRTMHDVIDSVLDKKLVWNQPIPNGYPKKQIGNVIGE